MGDRSGGRLVNLSTRGAVGTGADIMVAGFVIEGSETKDLVIRAVGPRLGDFGIPVTLLIRRSPFTGRVRRCR